MSPYNSRRSTRAIQPTNGAIYISESPNVSTSTGFPIASGVTYSENIALGDDPRLQLFAIAASGTVDVRITEYYNTKVIESVTGEKLPPAITE